MMSSIVITMLENNELVALHFYLFLLVYRGSGWGYQKLLIIKTKTLQ